MARDLERQGSLLEGDTGLPLLQRAALAAALSGNKRLCDTIGESLGEGSVEETARALRQTFLIANSPPATALARAGQALCLATGDPISAVLANLSESGASDDLGPLLKALQKLSE